MTKPADRALANAWAGRLAKAGDAARARAVARFFRSGPGQYGEGDRFLGLTVPAVRALAREARELPLGALETLLSSAWHEVRLFALVVLTERAKRLPSAAARLALAEWAFERRAAINNWDLVDVSIPTLFGGWMPGVVWRRKVETLLRSPSLWDRRMAMLTTFGWLRQGNLGPCFRFAAKLLGDKHDLIHKAVGWMLREAGKRDEARLRAFLDARAAMMPRTMLRYAIERLAPRVRQRYLLAKKG